MKTTCLRTAMVVVMACLSGCSGSDVSEVAELPMAETLAAASINATRTATPGSISEIKSSTTAGAATGTNEAPHKIEAFRNPFAPPKDPPPPPIVEKPEPESTTVPEATAEIRPAGTPAKIRLLGFMNIGEPKVLVSYRNELEALAIGDTLEDMKVIEIESPDLTMLFEEREIKLSLFDQAWQHGSESASSSNNSRAQTRPRPAQPSRNTSTSSSGGATAGRSAREPSGIPGFGPNAGKPPGFQPPTSSGIESTPGGPIGPPPALPGLPSEASGGGALGAGDLPGMPGIDARTGGNLGAGNLPTVPDGL